MSRPLRILSVEDDEADLQLALRALRKDGWEPSHRRVDSVADLKAALLDGGWDIVLMDFNMPGLDFTHSLAEVTRRLPESPVIMVSGSVGEERAIDMMRHGAWDLVLKDHLSRLGAAVQRCLREAAERAARRCAETELRLNEARLSLAVAAAEMGVWEWDLVSQRTFWSAQCSVIAGRDLANIGLDAFLAGIHIADQHRIRARIARALAERTHFALEFRLMTGNREERWVACHGRPHFDLSDTPLQVTGVLQDITLRKRIEGQLSQASAVFAGTQEGVLISDRDGTILAVNPAFCALMGMKQIDMIGQNARIFRSDRHDGDFYRAIVAEVADRGSWQGEMWNRRPDGSQLPLACIITAVRDQSGQLSGYAATYSDVSHIKESDAQLEFLTHHDPLTRLPNRAALMAWLPAVIGRAVAAGHSGALLVFGLDRFKELNDGFGHSAGDAVLRAVAERCRQLLRSDDLLARVGGDEFAVLLPDLPDGAHACRIAQSLIDSLATPLMLDNGAELFIGVSVGIGLFPGDGDTADLVIRNADAALSQAKQAGRGGYRFAGQQQLSQAAARVAMHSALHRGLERREFQLHYQPLVETMSRRVVGVEALLRWQPPDGDMVPPGRFIPLAEETGLMAPLGAWVLESACGQFKAWRDQGLDLEVLAVNLSPVQFKHPELLATIEACLRRTGLAARQLELEITEGALMDGAETEAKLRALKSVGVRLSIDDFGTGYSSLAYLKRFPIDKLKIDQSFVRDIPGERADIEIVTAIISLARSLQLDVLAEGVETDQQLTVLRSLDCPYFQGYLFSRPIAAPLIPALLATSAGLAE